MASIKPISHPVTHPEYLTEPLLPTASADISPILTSYRATAGQTAPTADFEVSNAYFSRSGGTMRTLLNAAVAGIARGTSAACHGAIDVSLAGYNKIVEPAGSAVINTSLAAVRNLAVFLQESVTGVEFVGGHKVSGRADSLLKLPRRLIPASVKDLFTPDGRGLSEKGLEFLKNVGTYGGGMAASFIYQMAIVGIADTVGRVGAQATSDKLEEGNFGVPLAVTGALTLVAAGQTLFLLKNMDLSDISKEERSTVIATHHGITAEEFDAKPNTERETLEAKTKRDWLMMAGGAALMPAGAFTMSLLTKLSSATAFANPLFMAVATNMVKEVVRAALYGGLREAGQEVFTGPKGGTVDLTHSEAGWLAAKYAGISSAVNLGQGAAKKAILNQSSLTHESTWGQKFSVLTAYSVINAIGESLNWADIASDRTKKCAELAKKDLTALHQAKELPPPTADELKAVAEQVEFAFNLGVKDQSFAEALRNIGHRYGGSCFARQGVYAYANAISNTISKLASKIEGPIGDKDFYNVLNNVLMGIGTTLTYIKFNASAQSLGALRVIRARNERETASALSSTMSIGGDSIDWDVISFLDAWEDSSGENIKAESFYINSDGSVRKRTGNRNQKHRVVQSVSTDIERAFFAKPRKIDRAMSDLN